MKFRDYYETLGIDRSADPDEVKRAYRRLARKYHPDVSKEANAESRFKEIGEAYEVLKDPEKRAAYDRLGANWRAGQEFTPPPGWEGFEFDLGGGRGGFRGGGGVDFSDFFESLFGGGGATGGGFGARGRRQRRGRDERLRVQIKLQEAYHGAERSVQVEARGGPGKPRLLRVKIPAGVVDGQQIRLSGQGAAGAGGAPAGDLFLEVLIAQHPFFRPEGRDVHLNLPVAPWEAALGATVKVPTLGGPVDLKIPAGTQSGNRLRLRGRGLGGSKPGDQYVTVQIVAPPADSESARDLYREMADKLAFEPRAHLDV